MTTTQDDFVDDVQAMITGIQKRAPNIVFTYASQTYTSAQLLAALQALETTGTNVTAARAAYHTAVLANDNASKQNKPFLSTLRHYVQGMFAGDETALADFGLSLPKPRKVPTATQLAARAAKAKATREARGTTSKKAKATITGNVTGVSITPITSSATGTPAASAPATAPAATAPATPAPVTTAPATSAAAPPSATAPATPAPATAGSTPAAHS